MIIVTGGAGFIGSALIAELNRRQISDILVVDELGADQKWKNLRNLSFADYVEKADFLEMVIEDKLDSPVDVVFHLGACSDTPNRMLPASLRTTTNTASCWPNGRRMPIFVLSTLPALRLMGTVPPASATMKRRLSF